MFVVNQLNQGYEPMKRPAAQEEVSNENKPDPTLIQHHFENPAHTDQQCRNLIWAIYWRARDEAKTTGSWTWPIVVSNYKSMVMLTRSHLRPHPGA